MSEKTQKPTPKKLRDARKRGEIVRSRELSSLGAFAGLWISLGLGGAYLAKHLASIVEQAITAGTLAPDRGVQSWLPPLQSLARDMSWILAPLLIASVSCAALIGALQTRGMISGDPITPKFERINPGEGLRRLFSTRQLIELAKMLVKTGLLMGMLLVYLSRAVDPLAKAVYSSAPSLLSIGATLAWRLMGWAAAIYVIGAVLDYAHQYYEFIKRQRMSIEELRRDLRETEGDPLIKHRRRVIGRELVFGALKNRISSASVVVVNPTHVSVALHYLPGRAELPRVIAKGVDGLALQIRTQAELEGVPILEDPPLARKLFREVGLDHYISEELIDVVAAAFRWARQVDRRSAQSGSRSPRQNPTPRTV
jgi:type III secretion protein U